MRFNQSKDNSLVKRVAKNNNRNNGDHHKIHDTPMYLPVQLFRFHYNSSLTNSTQFRNDSNYTTFNGENIATNCFMITVLVLDGLTKKDFGHYALLKIFSLTSPRIEVPFLYTQYTHNNNDVC